VDLRLSGLRVALEPEGALSPRERAALGELAAARDLGAPLDLRLELGLLPASGPAPPAEPAPAAVRAQGATLSVSHALFEARLDPFAGTGRVERGRADGGALLITLRVALAALLPLRGGLPLHAAGIVTGGRGLAFFGPSGAGKSTLSASARAAGLTVLSDEQVSLLGDPPRVLASGFWGALDGTARDAGAPLAALIELDRGPDLRLTRLTPSEALRRLLGALLVPPHAALWSRALAVAGRFARDVPVYRMAWNPAAPPWDALDARLASGAALDASIAEAHRA
jgi:hypothetical protein